MTEEDSKSAALPTATPVPPLPPNDRPEGPISMSRHILYGSIATPIKKPESDHTHKWTVYVRGFHGENIATYVKRVVFRLHDSFPNPSRSVEEGPFEVTETGWGEFQLNIRIVFQDPNQKPLNLVHHLKLYPTDEAANQLKTSKPVVSEHYEEIVFDPPTDAMASILVQEAQYVDYRTSTRYAEIAKLEEAENEKINAAIRLVEEQIANVEQNIAERSALPTASGTDEDSGAATQQSTAKKSKRR